MAGGHHTEEYTVRSCGYTGGYGLSEETWGEYIETLISAQGYVSVISMHKKQILSSRPQGGRGCQVLVRTPGCRCRTGLFLFLFLRVSLCSLSWPGIHQIGPSLVLNP